MSSATKRKHVFSEVHEFKLPEINQEIVKVLNSRGNNLHEVEAADGATYLVSMPTKFRKNVWVKKGDFILVEPIVEGDKVKAEMAAVLTSKYIKFLKAENVWPLDFGTGLPERGDDEFQENPNRPPCTRRDSSSESESE